ncbi:spermine synthase, partial [Arenimonas sp. MALMAid1274]
SLSLGRASPESLASGVFRTGASELAQGSQVRFLRDGKTATVAFYQQGMAGTIATNGKPDAAMQLDPSLAPSDDEITMLMLGSMPLAAHPSPKRIALIGWGSGLSTHTVLGSPVPEVVDSVEIERAMYDGAMLYGERVARAYRDPRSRLHIDDARTYFSAGKKKYDVIVSEPSNPWVSGVAGLFTHQFYDFLGNHLDEGGVLVQWIHTYELNDPLLATMLAALSERFPYIELYRPNFGDLIVVASHSPLQDLVYPAAEGSALGAELKRVGLGGLADFSATHMGSRAVVENFVRLFGTAPHDDFHPTVSLQAPRSRFRGDSAGSLQLLVQSGIPVLEMTDAWVPPRASSGMNLTRNDQMVTLPRDAARIAAAMRSGDFADVASDYQPLAAQGFVFRSLSGAPVPEAQVVNWMTSASAIAELTLAHLAVEDQGGMWIGPAWYVPEGQPRPVQAVMAAYGAAALRDGPAMLTTGRAALAELDLGYPTETREHMLVIAMLGALASGDSAEAVRLDREEGATVPVLPNSSYGFIRAYLLAWADRPATTPSPAS